jgi:hypothetical protein
VSGEARKQEPQQAQAPVVAAAGPRTHMSPANPPGSIDAVLQLQRAAGNRAASNAIQSATSTGRVVPEGGQRLAGSLREEMEERFGHDFGHVRVHTGAAASRSASALFAKAYTFGRDIVFGKGEFDPSTAPGRHVLAHELAHVVQQGRGGARPPTLSPNTSIERSADRAASAFSQGTGAVAVGGRSAPGIARVYRKNAAPKYAADAIFSELGEELGLDPAGTTKGGGAAKAARDARKAGFTQGLKPGTVDLAVQSHGSAPDVRKALKVVGQKIQSAHIAPTSALKGLKKYSRSEALTMLLPKPLHRQFDRHWQDWAKGLLEQRKAAGLRGDALKKVSVKELRTAVENAIEALPEPSPGKAGVARTTKNAMQWKLFDELHRNLGLKPNDLVKLPYSPLRSRISGIVKKGAGPAAAILAAGMRYRDLRATGHGQGESGAAAGAHLGLAGILGLASRSSNVLTKAQAGRMGGGAIGTVITLGNMGLQMLGVSKKVTDVTQTASDVVPVNMAGNMLEVTARAGANIIQGDWKAFDRQMKEVSEGKAGMPLEGYFRTFSMTADIKNEIADRLKFTHQVKGSITSGDVLNAVNESVEHNVLKQKFGTTTQNVWNATAAPLLLRQVKVFEGLARGKGLKGAVEESKQMEKNAPINRAFDYAQEQGKQFVEKELPHFIHQELPEARELASRDFEKLKAQVSETVDEKKQAAKAYLGEKFDAARRFLPF